MVCMDKQDFIFKARAAMKQYRDAKKRIEFLTISQSTKDQEAIFPYFLKLLETMTLKGGFPIVKDYAGCVVNHQHMHVLIKKPFIDINVLLHSWQRIRREECNLTVKTVSNVPGSVDRVINYIATQGDQHKTYDVVFVDSPRWGIVLSNKLTDDEKEARRIKRELKKLGTQIPSVNKSERWIYDINIKGLRLATKEEIEKFRL